MTRYAKEHKEETRQVILKAARKTFQTKGIDGTAIPALMGEAGLTHGGFYAHFRNKTHLLAEVCSVAMKRRSRLLAEAAERDNPQAELTAFVDDYLDPKLIKQRELGCLLPALAGEISRQEPEVREALTGSIEEYVARIAALMPGSEKEQMDKALVLASGMAGALMLARTVDDPELGERFVEAAREFYRGAFR